MSSKNSALKSLNGTFRENEMDNKSTKSIQPFENFGEGGIYSEEFIDKIFGEFSNTITKE